MRPEISTTPDGYRLHWTDGIEAIVERVTEHSEELACELTLNTERVPRPGLLHWGRFNLSSEQARSRLAAKLTRRDPDLDWDGLMEQLCVAVADRHRMGDPAVDLRGVIPSVANRWLVEPFVEIAGPTLLFADGGTGKSMTALAIACGLASGQGIVGKIHGGARPVLYLDWETDAATTAERMRAVCWGAEISTLPPVHYRRQIASLEAAAPEIRRELFRTNAGMAVVDSLGAARGGEPESADLTIRTFNAARTLGVPILFVDHVTKALGNGAAKSFGSVYSWNLARIAWSMDKAQEEGEHYSTILLTNRKRNNGHLMPKVALKMTIEADDDGLLSAVYFQTVDPASSAVSDRLGAKERVWGALSASFVLTAKELADTLGLSENVIRARLSDLLRAGRAEKEGEAWKRVEH